MLSSANAFNLEQSKTLQFGKGLSLSQTSILDASKLKEFTDDNFKFNGNGRKFCKWIECTVGKRMNCLSRAISPFRTVLLKDLYCRHIKTSVVSERVDHSLKTVTCICFNDL